MRIGAIWPYAFSAIKFPAVIVRCQWGSSKVHVLLYHLSDDANVQVRALVAAGALSCLVQRAIDYYTRVMLVSADRYVGTIAMFAILETLAPVHIMVRFQAI